MTQTIIERYRSFEEALGAAMQDKANRDGHRGMVPNGKGIRHDMQPTARAAMEIIAAADQPLTVREVAKAVGIEASQMSNRLSGLINKLYLTKHLRPAKYGKEALVTITDEGRRALERARRGA